MHAEYEPKGIEPKPNDVVFLERFARYVKIMAPGRRLPVAAPRVSSPLVVLFRLNSVLRSHLQHVAVSATD